MSRVELNTIQTKLKTAIQNHQMLVVKIKGDSQNLTLKKGLVELQEEIKRLSDEQKKIVVKLRESLVKSQNHETTITAIGQHHGQLMFPTQGGSTILPVSMLAVPIAHLQQPAVNMYIHPATGVPLSQATSISLMPANIFTAGCNIMNSGFSIGNNLLHSNITVNNFDNGINTAHFTTATSVSTNTSLVLSNVNIDPSSGVNGCPLVSNSNIVTSNIDNESSLVISNNNSLISSNNIISDSKATVSPLTQLPVSLNNTSCSVSSSSPSSNHAVSLVTTIPSATQSLSTPGTGIIGSIITQQPLVQPHLLQQQQQQILQMIQQQQQQPQQRLASHLPIKVPQYTASHIRPGSNPTPLQNGNSAPSPGIVTTTHCMKVATSISVPAFSKSTAINDIKSVNTIASAKVAADSHKAHTKLCQVATKKVSPHQTVIKQATSSKDDEKNQFMEKLGLYTATALNEVLRRRNERKRRTTANPHYSVGFEISRRDGTGNTWSSGASKKQRVRGKNDSISEQRNSKKAVLSDNHDDFCAACGQGGQLLMCETCQLVYHLDCLNPPLTEAPKYAWSCPKCLVSGKGLTNLNKEIQKYINLKSAKVERKKQIELINQELVCDKHYLEKRLKQLNEKLKEESLLQSELSSQETKKKEELNKLSNFVRIMKDSSTVDQIVTPPSSCV